jgi:Up-Regulated in long-lived daf-2
MADYNSKCQVRVTNNFPGTADIELAHQYSDDDPQKGRWTGIHPGTDTPYMDIGFNLGFLRTGDDWWQVEVNVNDGSDRGTWVSDSHACMLRSADNGKSLTFSVSPDTFVMTEISGTCSTGWSTKP